MKQDKITLSIETGIEGGSLSILYGFEEIDFSVGTKSVSRSEELLEEISALLKRNNIKKKRISMVAVSNSAGSYTGIRIGLATALGIRKAAGCRISGVSVLDALPLLSEKKSVVATAVSTNGRDIYLKTFKRFSDKDLRSETEAELLDYESFRRKVLGENSSDLLVNEKLYEYIFSDKTIKETFRPNIINAGKNLAKLIGRKAFESNASDNAKQVYIREFK